jgi:hypothetical protein
MRTTISLLALVFAAHVLEAQAPTRWEYGRLTATIAGALTVPTGWSAGDSSVATDSLLRRFASQSSKGGRANASVDPLLYVLNELGRQGWELVQVVPQFGFLFKRRLE